MDTRVVPFLSVSHRPNNTLVHHLHCCCYYSLTSRGFESKMDSFGKSKVWDTKTQKSIDAVRAFIHRHPQPTISHIQNQSLQERPLEGSFHLVSDEFPAPVEDDIRQALFRTINALEKESNMKILPCLRYLWSGSVKRPMYSERVQHRRLINVEIWLGSLWTARTT